MLHKTTAIKYNFKMQLNKKIQEIFSTNQQSAWKKSRARKQDDQSATFFMIFYRLVADWLENKVNKKSPLSLELKLLDKIRSEN